MHLPGGIAPKKTEHNQRVLSGVDTYHTLYCTTFQRSVLVCLVALTDTVRGMICVI